MRDYRPPLGVGRLAAGTLLISLAMLAAIFYAGSSGPSTHERRNPSTADFNNTHVSRPFLGNNAELSTLGAHDKRALGLNGLPNITLPALPRTSLRQDASLVEIITGDLNDTNTMVPNPDLAGGVSLLSQLEPAISPTLPPLSTAGEPDGTDTQGNALAVDPAQATSIIAAVPSLTNAVAWDAAATSDIVGGIESVLGGIASSINSALQEAETDLVGTLVDGLADALSELEGVLAPTDRPLDFASALVEESVCGIATDVNGSVQTMAGVCDAMSSSVLATGQANLLTDFNSLATDSSALLPTPAVTRRSLPPDVPPQPSPPAALPQLPPLPTGPGVVSITASLSAGIPDGGAGAEATLTNSARSMAPSALSGLSSSAPGPQPVPEQPLKATVTDGKCSQSAWHPMGDG